MPDAIFLNDTIVDATKGVLSTFDRGFLYGDGLFETVRAYNKNPFKLEDHIARLSDSAQFLCIPFRYTCDQIRHIIGQLLAKNHLSDAYIRLTLSRGYNANGFIPVRETDPTFVIHTKPLAPYPELLYKTGVKLIVSQTRKSASCPISRHKTLNYLTPYLIKKEALEAGAHDALILTTEGNVAECSVSNVFCVKDQAVFTPSHDANILSGITRGVVIDLCKESDIPLTEKLFGLHEIATADEVFITNSLMEIMPVSSITGNALGDAFPGKITGLLSAKYKMLTH
ncbi:aminodeoxychorismate lyase [Candidatus Kuenenia sp.]|uniref:aminodeoxychorismate lyase n=1 Tax=Candidatus Kuenenia sp. TaxID=2499824 RepID=UPI00321FEDB0